MLSAHLNKPVLECVQWLNTTPAQASTIRSCSLKVRRGWVDVSFDMLVLVFFVSSVCLVLLLLDVRGAAVLPSL